MMMRTLFVFGGFALIGLTIGCQLVAAGFGGPTQTGICSTRVYSTDPNFNCPTTATCYGPGGGTCTDGSGNTFDYVQETASKYSTCAGGSGSCVIISATLCTSVGYPNMNALGQCYGGAICTATVTQPGCRSDTTQ